MFKKLLNQLLGVKKGFHSSATLFDKIPQGALWAMLTQRIQELIPQDSIIIHMGYNEGKAEYHTIKSWKEPELGFSVQKGEEFVTIEFDLGMFTMDAPDNGFIYPLVSAGSRMKGGFAMAIFSFQEIDIEILNKEIHNNCIAHLSRTNRYRKPKLLHELMPFGLDLGKCLNYFGQQPKEYYQVIIPEEIPTENKMKIYGWCFEEGSKVEAKDDICTMLLDKGEINFLANHPGYIYPISPINTQLDFGLIIAIISKEKIDFEDLQNRILGN